MINVTLTYTYMWFFNLLYRATTTQAALAVRTSVSNRLYNALKKALLEADDINTLGQLEDTVAQWDSFRWVESTPYLFCVTLGPDHARLSSRVYRGQMIIKVTTYSLLLMPCYALVQSRFYATLTQLGTYENLSYNVGDQCSLVCQKL